MSKAAALPAPIRSAISVATAGVCLKCETVEMMTASTWSGVTPASATALPAASRVISATVSSGPAQCRVAMPERERIHSSSEESMCLRISSFGTTRVGRYPPTPRMRAYGEPCAGLIFAVMLLGLLGGQADV